MRELMQNLQAWYRSKTQQEQRILVWGVPLILLLVIYLVLIQPLASAWIERNKLVKERMDDLQWLRGQALLIERSNTSCDPREELLTLESIEAEMQNLARRLSLSAQIRSVAGSDAWQVTLANAAGNRVLGYVRLLSCGGVRATSLDFEVANVGDLTGTATLQLQLVSAP